MNIYINIHERDASYTHPKGYSRSVSNKWSGELIKRVIRVIMVIRVIRVIRVNLVFLAVGDKHWTGYVRDLVY